MLENVHIRLRLWPADGGKKQHHDMNFKELAALFASVPALDYQRFWIKREIIPLPGGDRIQFHCWL